MKPPFPGMDPWLEGPDWPDFYNSLAVVIKGQLVPQVAPHYIVRVEKRVLFESNHRNEIGILYPDIEVLESRKKKMPDIASEPYNAYGLPITPSTANIPLPSPLETRVPIVEIREREGGGLVTVIEILSPVNKRKPNLLKYRKKRAKLVEEGIHLLEIDLLRRGERPLKVPGLPAGAHYFVMLQRSDQQNVEVWAMTIRDPLPVVPVPLIAPAPDAKLDLGLAVKETYQNSRYDLSIDYQKAPPPPGFSEADQDWLQQILQKKN